VTGLSLKIKDYARKKPNFIDEDIEKTPKLAQRPRNAEKPPNHYFFEPPLIQ